MLKLYTRFHVQERFSWSSFVICILKSTFRYVNTNIQFVQVLAIGKQYLFTFYWVYLAFGFIPFSDLARSKDNVKKALLQFQIQLKKSGRSDIYSLPVFLGFALEICRSYLPWEFVATICRGNLPQLFAVAICRE